MSTSQPLAQLPRDLSPIPFPEPLRPLPYRVAVPFILALSLAFWAVLWQAGSYTAALLLS